MTDPLRVIGQAPMQTVRARDLAGVYAAPRKALGDLEARGAVHRLAYGYYCLVPAHVNPATWMPDLEVAAAAVATAIWGDGTPVLMGLSAARLHGALPRAIAEAVVAAPATHAPIELADRRGHIRFVTRAVAALDAVRVRTELGSTLATTQAQTALDLARDPSALDQPEIVTVIRSLLVQTTLDEVREIAAAQSRTGAALARVQKAAAA